MENGRHGVKFSVMVTGFTWETQNKASDRVAAQKVWSDGKKMLSDPNLHVVLLDEPTYMINYDYIDLEEVLTTINNRPQEISVIITGRGAHQKLKEIANTVSEVHPLSMPLRLVSSPEKVLLNLKLKALHIVYII
ncbi:MAG: hypothetical protein CENE_00395 [Candidatus Celerinatantimonas neptuna]|nr:MAG: hypothetical protein CENE_00395 [Candidatus Celerinatantimonas neptuna]